jgi:short-subunit dehydrogenase
MEIAKTGRMVLTVGWSSNIDEALTRIHAECGGDLVLVARRRNRLESLKTELEDAYGITVYVPPKNLVKDPAPS